MLLQVIELKLNTGIKLQIVLISEYITFNIKNKIMNNFKMITIFITSFKTLSLYLVKKIKCCIENYYKSKLIIILFLFVIFLNRGTYKDVEKTLNICNTLLR